MKAMLTITTFDGGDPAAGEQRTMTIGAEDPADLARRVSEWAHDVVLRMAAGDEPPDDDDDLRIRDTGLDVHDLAVGLWEDLMDNAA